MADHKLMPQHGKEFSLPIDDATKRYDEIYKLLVNTGMELELLMAMSLRHDKVITIPCKQCVRDIALKFRDLAGMIEDSIAERKKDGCGND